VDSFKSLAVSGAAVNARVDEIAKAVDELYRRHQRPGGSGFDDGDFERRSVELMNRTHRNAA
jgi:hypothetical protein